MSQAVKITQAAKELRKTPSTIRRWIRQGCPTVQLGETGREGSLVILEDIKLWRAGIQRNDDIVMDKVAIALLDALKRDGVHERAGTSERQAAMILLLAFNRYFKNEKLREIDRDDKLPDAIVQICTIALY
ncbi:MAG: hypothetical protein IT392_01150 [Nitrospirae bacterium]|nr:hypothetical protein [Nitrospirota bacterium]